MSAYTEVLTRLAAVGYPVKDSDATDPDGTPYAPPYVVVSGGNLARMDDERLAKGQDPESDHVVEFSVMAIASTANGARIIGDLARGLLVGWTPTVSGRRMSSVRFEGGDEPRRDMTVLPQVWYSDADYSVTSRR